MANRTLNQFQLTYEKDSVTIYASINVGASGAVSSFAGGGISNVTKSVTAGQYVLTMTNKFSKFLNMRAESINTTADGIANIQMLATPSTMQADIKSSRQITIQCVDFTNTAANPPSGSQLQVVIVMRNTSVGA